MERLFVSLDLPQEVKDYLFDLEKKLNSNFAKVKWVSKKHLHITLKFIGEVSEEKVEDVIERLSKVKARSIKVTLSKVGIFNNESDIRVLWVGFTPEDGVNAMQQDVDGELLDLFSEPQKFSSHITLGRVKRVNKKEEFLKKLMDTEVKPLQFEFSGLKLYKSVLKGSTQKYVCLKEF